MAFELPKLEYAYDSLEPYIDAKTMEIHHDKHHRAYTDKFNSAIAGTELETFEAEDIITNIDDVPSDIKNAVRNNGGGYVNHKLFWTILKKDVEFFGEIKQAIEKTFGSLEKFKEEFSNAALTQFGSGWAWLVVNKEGNLEITKTSNQDSPLSEGKKPILCIDVWEHAYYLKYQNKRQEYVNNFFSVINWERVNQNFLDAKR